MTLKKWSKLPVQMQTEEVRYYYNILKSKKWSRFFKRLFDIVVAFVLLVILSPLILILAAVIKCDSKGPVFYRQTRITKYGEEFRIFKFRTMICGADKFGSIVTINNDSRITRSGRFIRKYRLDEIPQLIDVLRGKMSFVGTRPEVPKYFKHYTPEMLATVLMPAGITSETSIFYKDESKLLSENQDVDKTYIELLMPKKMFYNLKSIENFSFWHDIKIMFMTVLAVLGKEYTPELLPPEMPEKQIYDKEMAVR